MTDRSSQSSSVPRPEAQGVTIRRQRAFFYRWWVVAGVGCRALLGLVRVYPFSVFLKPLMQEGHAGRAAISLGYTRHLKLQVQTALHLGAGSSIATVHAR
jgi:hypothetical protein